MLSFIVMRRTEREYVSLCCLSTSGSASLLDLCQVLSYSVTTSTTSARSESNNGTLSLIWWIVIAGCLFLLLVGIFALACYCRDNKVASDPVSKETRMLPHGDKVVGRGSTKNSQAQENIIDTGYEATQKQV